MDLTQAERYLVSYHDAKAGTTSRAFENLSVVSAHDGVFSSTYDALVRACLDALGVGREPQAVLDLGCGDGFLLSLVARVRPDVQLFGVDLSEGELSAARSRLKGRATLARGKAQQIPLGTASVAAVISHLALMLMDNVGLVASEVRRVLIKGGTFVGLVNDWPPPSIARDAFSRLYPRSELQPEFATMRLGDRRLGSRLGIREWLSRDFDEPEFVTLASSRDCTPETLWDWFSDTYDACLLQPQAFERFRQAYLDDMRASADQQGNVHCEERFLMFMAKAR